MSPFVTIGIPIYKRLQYLPHVLKIVAAQDYQNIDLLVSDNGQNGDALPAIIDKHYRRPYRLRRNVTTVGISRHFTQLIDNARGEYMIILADDDEISTNFVSDLVQLLAKHPEASAAFAVEEVIDEAGCVLRKSKPTVPELMSGADFIRSTWGTWSYGFGSFCTFLARTERLREAGGFPEIWAGTSDEDLLVIKLSLNSHLAFSTRSTFRKRFDEKSEGYAIDLSDLARGIREYLALLDSDAQVRAYAEVHAAEWAELRQYLVASAWNTYYLRWSGMYRKRMSPLRWIAAGRALPFPEYAQAWVSTVARAPLNALKEAFLHAVSRNSNDADPRRVSR
jgi:glycosyltransferase involved in cell wall biosynthesis